MTDFKSLFEECDTCKREVSLTLQLFDRLRSSEHVLTLGGQLLDRDGKTPGEFIPINSLVVVNCPKCNNKRKTLTDEGEALWEYFKDSLKEEMKEKPKEIPF